VKASSVSDRLKVVDFFINVADKLIKLKNYQDSIAIIRAFSSWSSLLEPTFRVRLSSSLNKTENQNDETKEKEEKEEDKRLR